MKIIGAIYGSTITTSILYADKQATISTYLHNIFIVTANLVRDLILKISTLVKNYAHIHRSRRIRRI